MFRTIFSLTNKFAALLIIFAFSTALFAQTNNVKFRPPAKADKWADKQLKKMTVDEKIGQLNLLNPGGGVATGAVVSSGVETKIKSGGVGALFGIIGVGKIRQAQQLAVSSRG